MINNKFLKLRLLAVFLCAMSWGRGASGAAATIIIPTTYTSVSSTVPTGSITDTASQVWAPVRTDTVANFLADLPHGKPFKIKGSQGYWQAIANYPVINTIKTPSSGRISCSSAINSSSAINISSGDTFYNYVANTAPTSALISICPYQTTPST